MKPLTGNAGSSTELDGMDGVVMNQSLLELAAAGSSHCYQCIPVTECIRSHVQ